jgi:hypothetical protein
MTWLGGAGDFIVIFFICLAPLGNRVAAWVRTWDKEIDAAMIAKGL